MRRLVLSIVTALAVSLLGASAASAADRVFPILVMGDSYSAGNGAGGYIGAKGCWRSPNNYGTLYAHELTQAPYDVPTIVETVACSGDTTQAFLTTTHRRRPQLASVNGGYGLILLTTGGNDVGFAKIVQNCLITLFANTSGCARALESATQLLRDGILEARLEDVLQRVRLRANRSAAVVLLGYPHLESDLRYKLGRGKKAIAVGERLRKLQDRGEAIQRRVVATLNRRDHTHAFVFVDVTTLFAGHELSATGLDSARWFVAPMTDATIASRATWYHPNPTGWAEEAQLLLRDSQVPKMNPIAPAPPCRSTLLFEAAVTREGISATEGYPDGSPPGASEVTCAGTWAVALISRPSVGTTDGFTLFRATGPRWSEITTLGGSDAACQLEQAGVPKRIAVTLAHGVTHSGIAGC